MEIQAEDALLRLLASLPVDMLILMPCNMFGSLEILLTSVDNGNVEFMRITSSKNL